MCATFARQRLPLGRKVKRRRGGLVFKAHRLLFHSTLGSRVIKKKKKRPDNPPPHGGVRPFHQKSTCPTRLTLGPCVVQISARPPPNLGVTKPSHCTERWGGVISCKTPLKHGSIFSGYGSDHMWIISVVVKLNLRITTSQKCAADPRRARI